VRPEFFHDDPPEWYVGKYSGKLTIFGPGWSLLEDYAKWGGEGDVMAVNAVGMHLNRFEHWYTTHPEYIGIWRAARKVYFDEPDNAVVHCKQGGVTGVPWPISGRYAALSGETACIVACELGYTDIILAGIPADGKGHYYPAPIENGWKTPYDHGEDYALNRWRWLRDNYFNGRVKSLSGNTKDILGC
jgi:hypothetical protein